MTDDGRALRRGWTTGACAAAAAKAAFAALRTGAFPDPVSIPLPRGGRTAFALAETGLDGDTAVAGVVKDAGDDPDVTHGALIRARVGPAPPGTGVHFRAGSGVGTVTRPGLPLPPGEPAINPVPREMIRAALAEIADAPDATVEISVPGGERLAERTLNGRLGIVGGLSILGTTGVVVPYSRAALAEIADAPDATVEISVPGGERLAERTLNGRLGIVGGLSILGTTGVVVPYSCAAWISTIHRGIDVARAAGLLHVAGSTGSTSEAAVKALHGLPDPALLEMGDFAGGMLKYLRHHPVPRVTVAGGVAKMTKLAQGRLDLHSKRGAADMDALAALVADPALARRIAAANTVAEAFGAASEAGVALGDTVARGAWRTAAAVLDGAGIELEVVLFDRGGAPVGRAPFAPVRA